MQPVTLKRLAQELSLSIGTVSRALNDSYDISPATKARVRALAKALNYEPNPYAGSLRHHKSRTIGVIVPEVANPFFALVINGVEEVARQNNYHVLIYLSSAGLSAHCGAGGFRAAAHQPGASGGLPGCP